MLKTIDEEAAIARYQKQFIRGFKPFITEKISVKIGHQGASFPAKVLWSDELDIWVASPKSEEKRHWHIFGLGKPAPTAHLPIACEINFPVAGIDRKIGAAFVQDEKGRIFVIHRGKIGGSQKGIGKALFENHYRGVWAHVDDGGTTITAAVVGELHSPHFTRQIAQFVHKIARIKERATVAASRQLTIPFDTCRFAEELTGASDPDPLPDLAGSCDHPLIVRDLAAALAARGLRIGNDAERDLFILGPDGRVAVLFQINTDQSPKGIHADIAKLLLGGGSTPHSCRQILAVPALPAPSLADRLASLHVEILLYTWGNGQAVFPGLGQILLPQPHAL